MVLPPPPPSVPPIKAAVGRITTCGMVKVPLALASDGRVGFPGSAARGADWRCPGCDKRVVLKRGAVLQPHFAHHVTTGCTGGESIVHRATKEWIAANMSNPDFRITALCRECSETHAVFRGAAGVTGHTEMPVLSGKYVVDASAVGPTRRVIANVEVVHTHASSPEKMNVVGAEARDGAVEVAAVDLVAEGYPLEFRAVQSANRRRCRPCLRHAVLQRRAAAVHRRERGARTALRSWGAAVAAAKARRMHRFGRRWLLLHRAPRASAWAARAAEALHARMFKPCHKCNEDVQIKRWTSVADGKCNRHELVFVPWDSDEHGHCYHARCSPNCSGCGETRKPGKWCACDKAAHRKCTDCGKWKKKEAMDKLSLPNGSLPRSKTEWVCETCAAQCTACGGGMSKKQAFYGGRCYPCNRAAVIRRAGGDPTEGCCEDCGHPVSNSRYTRCYDCHSSHA